MSTYDTQGTITYFKSILGETITPEIIKEIAHCWRMADCYDDRQCKVCGKEATLYAHHFNPVCMEHEKYGVMYNLPLALQIDGLPLPPQLDIVKSIEVGTPQYYPEEEITPEHQEYLEMLRSRIPKE